MEDDPLIHTLTHQQPDLLVLHGKEAAAATTLLRQAAQLSKASLTFEHALTNPPSNVNACRLAQGGAWPRGEVDAEELLLKVTGLDGGGLGWPHCVSVAD